MLRFEVVDSGIGIAAEALESVFQPFQQVGDQDRQAEGTGLGLSISRNLVALMGGDLQVRSEAGQGSAFWFDLALPVVEGGTVAGAAAMPILSGPRGEGRTILAVDDRWENRAVLVDLLSPLGFTVAVAEDGRAGLTQAESLNPDIIITDLLMPEMDGYELIRRIRASAALQATPIIAVSASVYEADEQRSLVEGGDVFLPKPIDADRLLQQIQRLLGLETGPEQPPAARALVDAEPAQLVLPPAETLESLHTLAVSGDIEALRTQLSDLAQSDERFAPFTDQLQQLADDFKLGRIRELLKESLA